MRMTVDLSEQTISLYLSNIYPENHEDEEKYTLKN